jgi:hypothetical protein
MSAAPCSIGFRAKTGRAIAVVLSGSTARPLLVWRDELSLVDPKLPETGQPYHEVMELPWPQAIDVATRFEAAIEKVASAALRAIIARLESKRLRVRSVAIVGSLDRNLERIGNPHIRAHAAEGILFRRVLESAAAAHRIPCRTFSEEMMKKRVLPELDDLGAQAGPPWRGDHKSAATAAWLALHPRR